MDLYINDLNTLTLEPQFVREKEIKLRKKAKAADRAEWWCRA